MASKSLQLMTRLRQMVDLYRLPGSMFCATKAIASAWEEYDPADGRTHANELRDNLILAVLLSKRAPREYGGKPLDDACDEYAEALAKTGEFAPKDITTQQTPADLEKMNKAASLRVTRQIVDNLSVAITGPQSPGV